MSVLDSPQACISELSEINQEVGRIGSEWAQKAGELKAAIVRKDRLYRTSLLGIPAGTKLTVAERDATAYAAIEKVDAGLLERVEKLEGLVEQHKTLFKTLERRASNAQSILAAMRDEARMSEYVR